MTERHAPLRAPSMPCRVAHVALAACLALACVPAVALSRVASDVGSAWAYDTAEVFVGWVNAESPDGKSIQLQMFFTVVGDHQVAVGRGNKSGEANYAIDADFKGTVTIPSCVISDVLGDFDVVGIEEYAFSGGASKAASLTGVVIPQSVSYVGADAFQSCTSLESVIFEGSEDSSSALTSIGAYAFDTTSIESVEFPASLQTLGEYAFAYCEKLAEVEFANIDESALTTIGGSCFRATSGKGALKSIVLPAGLRAVSDGVFYNQQSLESVEFLGDKIDEDSSTYFTIGQDAFYNCKSLVSIEIPQLYKSGATSIYNASIAGRSFYGCSSLSTIIFKGDMADVSVAGGNTEPAFNVSPIETVVYYGSALPGTGNNTDGVKTGQNGRDPAEADVPFFDWFDWLDDVSYYYNVTFGGVSNSDGDADVITSARIRDDVTVAQIKDQIAGRAYTLTAGAEVYDDGGTLPGAQYANATWAFEEGYIDSSTLTDSTFAYITDTSSGKVDIRACSITLDLTTYVTGTKPIALNWSIKDAAGNELTPDVDYEVGLLVLGADGDWVDAQDAHIDNLQSIIDAGSYRLYFMAAEGSSYKGQTYASFKVVKAADSLNLQTPYAWSTSSTANEYSVAYPAQITYRNILPELGGCQFGILVSVDDPWGLAASTWLSNALGGAVIVPFNTETFSGFTDLSLSVLRGQVAESGTVLVMGDSTIIGDEVLDSALYQGQTVTRLSYSAGSEAQGVAKIFRSFTNIGAKSGSTAYVIASDGSGTNVAAYAALINAYHSFDQADPIFFCSEDGALDPATRYALKTGGFSRVVMVGASGITTDVLEAQVSNRSMTFEVIAGTPVELSRNENERYFSEHAADCEVVYTSPSETGGAQAIVSSLVAGYRDATLVYVDSLEEAQSYVPSLMTEDRVLRTPNSSILVMNSLDDHCAFVQGMKALVNSLYGAVSEEEGGDGNDESAGN